MGQTLQFFEDVHASWKTELAGLPTGIPDSAEVSAARQAQDSAALAKALTKQLRYREAAEACTAALEQEETLPVLRLRAGKYLATLQLDKARQDFSRCAELGAEALDTGYRLGICEYYAGNYAAAMEHLSQTFPLADDEMGIAVLYWHTMSAYRSGLAPTLLKAYHPGMAVGHHTGYEKAMRLCSGAISPEEALRDLTQETEDLEFSLVAYGIARYLLHTGMTAQGEHLLAEIRRRDSFWVSFAFLAAINDKDGGGR